MEVTVDDQGIAMSILCGLPERFEHLIVAIDGVADESNLSLEFVKSRLLQEEQRMDERHKPKLKTDSALVSKKRSTRICTWCTKRGYKGTLPHPDSSRTLHKMTKLMTAMKVLVTLCVSCPTLLIQPTHPRRPGISILEQPRT